MSWRDRFEALLAQRLRMPFAWGMNDCCMFAADCVQAVSGIDPAADWRGTYSDEAGADRVLADVGGIEAAGARAGPEIAPLAAAVGDVGLVVLDDRQLLAVCAGAVWLMPTARGLGARPLDQAAKAWRVARG